MTNSSWPCSTFCAVLEMHGLDRAGHARPHLDRVHRLEAAGVVVPVRHLLRERLRHLYGGRASGGGAGSLHAAETSARTAVRAIFVIFSELPVMKSLGAQ